MQIDYISQGRTARAITDTVDKNNGNTGGKPASQRNNFQNLQTCMFDASKDRKIQNE